jgi:hypothetical protein
MTEDWRYKSEHVAIGPRRGHLLAVYRTRPGPPGEGDEIFGKGGWRPTWSLVEHRLGHNDRDLVDISKEEAERLTQDLHDRWWSTFHRAVADLVAGLRSNGMVDRAEQVSEIYARIGTDPEAEARLHDLIRGSDSTFITKDAYPDDEDARVAFNRAVGLVANLTQPAQR